MLFFTDTKTKQFISLMAILLLMLFLFYSLYSFIPSFLGALVLFIVLSPLMHVLTNKWGFNESFSALVLILLSLFIVAGITYLITDVLIVKLKTVIAGSDLIQAKVIQVSNYIKKHFDFNILNIENITKVQSQLTRIFSGILQETFTIVLHLSMMFFILFYMLISWENITDMAIKYLPYEKENAELFAKELISQTYSNVIGAPLLAAIQGLFSAIGFWFFDLPEPFFWGLICGFLSFVPFVGTALIWLPAGIVQLSAGLHWQGIGLLIYGATVITMSDNVIRFVLQRKIANIHPLITVLGVIFGISTFGLPGIIFGPLLISYLILMIKVYRIEYKGKSIL
jgi:predicted PurR-regulated permease PerM